MSEIEKLVLAHRYLYYVKSRPVISDRDYDALEKLALAQHSDSETLNAPGSDLQSSYSDEVKALALTL